MGETQLLPVRSSDDATPLSTKVPTGSFHRGRVASGEMESGTTAIFVGLLLFVIFGFAALAVDVGHLYVVRTELQTAADAASTAAARGLPIATVAEVIAIDYADRNDDGAGPLTKAPDVVVGNWDTSTRTFVASGLPLNAVQVTTRRSAAYGNPVEHLFARVLGFETSDVSATAISLKRRAVIDFEGIPAGDQPSEVSAGYGISGDDISGEVAIGSNTAFGPMVFDATCGGGPASNCSGGDNDLFLPGQGGVLIISEDGDASDPDDFGGPCPTGASANDAPSYAEDADDITTDCTLVLDFEDFGDTGLVTVTDVTLVDVEEDAFVWLYRDGNLVAEVQLTLAGDGMVAQRFLPSPVEADLMVVKLNGSGAVDDIGYSETVQLVG